jgi:peptidoglycan/xylan/chitin deacetylase (PgdA/CDA1 family)
MLRKRPEKTFFFPVRLIPGKRFESHEILLDGHPASIPLSDSLIKLPDYQVLEDDVVLHGERKDGSFTFPVVWYENEEIRSCIDLPKWIRVMQQEQYRPVHTNPITALLPFHYHRIPGALRNLFAFILIQIKKIREKALYPITPFNPGCELLLSGCGISHNYQHRSVVVLAHDIDTKHGFAWIRKIARIEEGYGFRSAWNLVPKSYSIDRLTLQELKARGHEIGLHGIWHNNREAFVSEEKLHQEFTDLQPLMNEFDIRGYRGPSWYRTKIMFDVLEKHFEYDCSCLDNDFICPAGSGGVGMIRPFRIRENLVEIPCTLPFDVPLLLGYSSSSLLDYWLPKIKWIKSVCGVLAVNTHPDPNYIGNEPTLEVYKSLLAQLEQEGWQCMLPYEIAKESQKV